MQNDCAIVDALVEEIADCNSRYGQVAIEKLKQLCSQSYEAFGYLYVHMLNGSLPAPAQRRLDDVVMTVRTHSVVSYERWRTTSFTGQDGQEAVGSISRYL